MPIALCHPSFHTAFTRVSQTVALWHTVASGLGLHMPPRQHLFSHTHKSPFPKPLPESAACRLSGCKKQRPGKEAEWRPLYYYGSLLRFVPDAQMSALLSLECPPEGMAETYLDGAPRMPACCGGVHEQSCCGEGGSLQTEYLLITSSLALNHLELLQPVRKLCIKAQNPVSLPLCKFFFPKCGTEH